MKRRECGVSREGRFHDPPGNLVDFGFEKVSENEKAVRVKHHFDSIAHRYDAMNTLLSFGIHYLWKRAAVRSLDLKEGESVLDVCGGTGDLAVLAARRIGASGRVVISDVNRRMIEVGRGKTTHAHERNRLLYLLSDAERMALRADSFDAVVVGFGLRNLTHMASGLREVHRLLKPGGRFACLEFSRPATTWFRRLYDVYSFRVMPFVGLLGTGSRKPFTHLPESIRLFPGPEELVRLFEEAGFSHVTYQRLTNGIAAVHRGTKSAMGEPRSANEA